jgi:hypothetical protein
MYPPAERSPSRRRWEPLCRAPMPPSMLRCAPIQSGLRLRSAAMPLRRCPKRPGWRWRRSRPVVRPGSLPWNFLSSGRWGSAPFRTCACRARSRRRLEGWRRRVFTGLALSCRHRPVCLPLSKWPPRSGVRGPATADVEVPEHPATLERPSASAPRGPQVKGAKKNEEKAMKQMDATEDWPARASDSARILEAHPAETTGREQRVRCARR